MQTERKQPFEWTDADRAKLAPGATVTHVSLGRVEFVEFREEGSCAKVIDRPPQLDCVLMVRLDPATIEPPKPTLVERLRELRNYCSGEIQSIDDEDAAMDPCETHQDRIQDSDMSHGARMAYRGVLDRIDAILKEHTP